MITTQISRYREPELMDEPDLDETAHRQALRGLQAINRASRTITPLWRAVLDAAREQPGKPLSVLDVACGGGDVAIQLAQRARLAGLPLTVSGCDISPTAIHHARHLAESAGRTDIEFFRIDILQEVLERQFDLVMCNLFLHHLDELDAIRLLEAMAGASRRMILVDDLRRTRLGLALAWVACRVLSQSPIVHTDGPRSVRAAFTPKEALSIAARAGLDGARVSCHWPQRFLLEWRRI